MWTAEGTKQTLERSVVTYKCYLTKKGQGRSPKDCYKRLESPLHDPKAPLHVKEPKVLS